MEIVARNGKTFHIYGTVSGIYPENPVDIAFFCKGGEKLVVGDLRVINDRTVIQNHPVVIIVGGTYIDRALLGTQIHSRRTCIRSMGMTVIAEDDRIVVKHKTAVDIDTAVFAFCNEIHQTAFAFDFCACIQFKGVVGNIDLAGIDRTARRELGTCIDPTGIVHIHAVLAVSVMRVVRNGNIVQIHIQTVVDEEHGRRAE